MQVTIAVRSSCQVVHVQRSRTRFFSRLTNDSMAALSPAAPTLPHGSDDPVPVERTANFRDQN